MSGQDLFGRRVQVVVDTMLITDLRVQFKVKKTLKKEPSKCDLLVSNLSENSRAGLQKVKHPKVIVEAGYPDTMAQIFSGESRFVDQVLEGATWNTKIQCGDGERAYTYRRVNESFRPGTRVSDVIETVMKSLGLPVIGHLAELREVTEQFMHGYTAFGKVATELDHLLAGRGFSWSIQDGQLQIIHGEKPTADSVILLNEQTGLIGSPEHGNPEKDVPIAQISPEAEDFEGFTVPASKKKGPAVLKVKSLLQPGFRPGRRVKVESKGVNGVFRIETVEHSGDTHGGEWFSSLECLPST